VSKYAYVAIDESGKECRGILEAETEKEALSQLSKQGLFPTEVHRAGIADGLREEVRSRVEAERIRREQEEAKRQQKLRQKHPRQRLVVHYKDGRVSYGVSYHLNPRENYFHLDCTDLEGHATDERETVTFSDIKAVFYVRAYDGKFDKRYPRPAVDTRGPELVVEFEDGEVLEGRAVNPVAEDTARFTLVPHDEGSNNLGVLVERSATRGVFTPEEWKERRKQARAERAEERKETNLTKEETTGDFYFETRDYKSALSQYEQALEQGETSNRLQRKVVVCKYNIGMQFVRRRDYPKALEIMNEVLEIDPRNEQARKKVKKLKKIIHHMAHDGGDEEPE